jgi:hypothetical protein
MRIAGTSVVRAVDHPHDVARAGAGDQSDPPITRVAYVITPMRAVIAGLWARESLGRRRRALLLRARRVPPRPPGGGRRALNALGPPRDGAAREAMKSAPRGGRLAGRRSRPPRPGAGWPSGLRCRRAMDRRAADLGARGDHAAPAPWWLTRYPPEVRVGGGGGGRSRARCRSRPGSRLRWACGTEGCLSQRRELECRSHGTAHQLAKRALVRSAGRQRGEHVFGKVGVGSDGMGARCGLRFRRFGSRTRKMRCRDARDLARVPGR